MPAAVITCEGRGARRLGNGSSRSVVVARALDVQWQVEGAGCMAIARSAGRLNNDIPGFVPPLVHTLAVIVVGAIAAVRPR